jgi:hypothetical protein
MRELRYGGTGKYTATAVATVCLHYRPTVSVPRHGRIRRGREGIDHPFRVLTSLQLTLGLAGSDLSQSHIDLPSRDGQIKRKRRVQYIIEQIFRTKGLTSADRSNKATLPLTVPRSHSSRLQRIQPCPYSNCNSWTSHHNISTMIAKST